MVEIMNVIGIILGIVVVLGALAIVVPDVMWRPKPGEALRSRKNGDMGGGGL